LNVYIHLLILILFKPISYCLKNKIKEKIIDILEANMTITIEIENIDIIKETKDSIETKGGKETINIHRIGTMAIAGMTKDISDRDTKISMAMIEKGNSSSSSCSSSMGIIMIWRSNRGFPRNRINSNNSMIRTSLKQCQEICKGFKKKCHRHKIRLMNNIENRNFKHSSTPIFLFILGFTSQSDLIKIKIIEIIKGSKCKN